MANSRAIEMTDFNSPDLISDEEYNMISNEIICFIRKRYLKSLLKSLFITIMCAFYYADIASDIFVAIKYYQEGSWRPFELTIAFIIIPWILYLIIILAAYKASIASSWNNGKYLCTIFIVIRIVFQLEMLYW